MDVSIIFVNYKTKDLTINAIKSVFEKTKELEFEIFVVDNNSQDGSIEAIEKEFPNINIIKNSINSGFGSANNLAIKQAKGKYILCLNTDTLLINNAIKIMFDFMEKEENQNVGVCGGFLVNTDGKPCVCGGNLPSIIGILWKFKLRDIFKEQYKAYASGLLSDENISAENFQQCIGADIFFRKDVLNKVGYFDEQYFMYMEETDLCKRIHNAGYEIKFVPTARIIHMEGASSQNINKLKLSKQSEWIYFKKYYRKPHLFIIKILYSLLFLFDWMFLRNIQGKEIFFYILKEWRI